MAENIVVSAVIPANAQRIYDAWLSADEHGKMTGSAATAEADGRFTAWDGYISGKTLETVPGQRIVQQWRTTEFPAGAPDSKLAISLEAAEGGTRVTLDHSNLPDGQGESYEQGWHEHYFNPMKDYFRTPGARLKEVGHALEEAAEKAGEAVEHAVEDVSQQVEATAKQALKAVDQARATAKKQATKAVKSVKRAQKKAVARAKVVGKKLRAALTRKKKPAKAAKRKAAPKKKAAKKKKR